MAKNVSGDFQSLFAARAAVVDCMLKKQLREQCLSDPLDCLIVTLSTRSDLLLV